MLQSWSRGRVLVSLSRPESRLDTDTVIMLPDALSDQVPRRRQQSLLDKKPDLDS
jgi:hypothetical protein